MPLWVRPASLLRQSSVAALIFAGGAVVALLGDPYLLTVVGRAWIYWVLVSGLNLVVGFAGQLAIGHVALLAIGGYTASALIARTGLWPPLAFVAATAMGGMFGLLIGLPALRLRTFYYAMASLGFAQITFQVAVAWSSVTGGGMGLPGPTLPAPFDGAVGFYSLCLGLAACCTVMTFNLAGTRFGRSLAAIRDAETAAESLGISRPAVLVRVLVFSGAVAGLAGALFADLQSYITPDAFTLDISLLFFIAVLVGGSSSITGPLIATLCLTLLPEVAAPLVRWSTFVYALLLLLIAGVFRGGVAALWGRTGERHVLAAPARSPRQPAAPADAVAQMLGDGFCDAVLRVDGIAVRFGQVRAIEQLALTVAPGQIHGLIGPNGSGKTTTLNVISGFVGQQAGTVRLGTQVLRPGRAVERAGHGIARTFQTPHLLGDAPVLDNVLLGADIGCRAGFLEAMLALPRARREERAARARALAALEIVGLAGKAARRADALQHGEQRFLEIARCLMIRPRFLLLDEPAAGLAQSEIRRLAAILRDIAGAGVGVLLVEHHVDLVFGVSDHVTVLALGQVLAAGPPAQVRSRRDVVEAYLGG